VEEGFSGLDVLDALGEGSGKKGLDALRDQLITPGLEESGDPMMRTGQPVTV